MKSGFAYWRNKQYEETIEDVKVRKGDAQAEWNCLWVSFFVVFLLFQTNKIEALMRKLKYSRINITMIFA